MKLATCLAVPIFLLITALSASPQEIPAPNIAGTSVQGGEVDLEDPEVFTRPWKMTMPLYRRMEGNAQVFEYKCLEFVEELLYGHSREAPYNVVEDYEKWYRESRLDVQ